VQVNLGVGGWGRVDGVRDDFCLLSDRRVMDSPGWELLFSESDDLDHFSLFALHALLAVHFLFFLCSFAPAL
jgi:hypothetical protein